MTHRRAEPAHRFRYRGGAAAALPRRTPRAPDRPPPGRSRPHGAPAPVAGRHAGSAATTSSRPTRARCPCGHRGGRGRRRDSVRGPVAMLGQRPHLGMALQPAHLVSTASTRRGGTSSGRCSRCPTPPGTSAAATSSDRRGHTPSPRPCTSRPSPRRRPPTRCATPHRRRRCRVGLDLDAPRRPAPYGRGDEPDHDTPAPSWRPRWCCGGSPLDRGRAGPPALGAPAR